MLLSYLPGDRLSVTGYLAIVLFHMYAIESERGISRTEIFQLVQDHSETLAPADSQVKSEDPRHFERFYTWLKKHVSVYDKSRTGFLPLRVALEMLDAHPTALSQLRFQLDAFVRKLKENNERYEAKAKAAEIEI